MTDQPNLLYIIDNGQRYSDRQIWFVSVPAGRGPELEQAMKENAEARGAGRSGYWRVIGIVSVAEWRGGAPKDLQAALDEIVEDTNDWKDIES